jgi:hypothetical protein
MASSLLWVDILISLNSLASINISGILGRHPNLGVDYEYNDVA